MFKTYIKSVRPNLSDGSVHSYGQQLKAIAKANNFKPDISPLMFVHKMANKAMRDSKLKFIKLEKSKQAANIGLSAVKVLLIANKDHIHQTKYDKLFKAIGTEGRTIRNEISESAGNNNMSIKEAVAFKTSWDDIQTFAKSYHSLDKHADRDYILLNLVINNFEEKDDIKYNVLLRSVEYSSLFIWKHRKKPPADHRNYIYLSKNLLWIQNSKTTGGIKALSNGVIDQVKLKTYPINNVLMIKIKEYIKNNKLKHLDPLFLNNIGDKQMSSNFFGKLVSELLYPLNVALSPQMLRKVYSNRPLPNLNHNQKMELNKLVDHNIQTESAFYMKNTE